MSGAILVSAVIGLTHGLRTTRTRSATHIHLVKSATFRPSVRFAGTSLTYSEQSIVLITRNWVKDWVSKYSLCPWSAGVLLGERLVVSVLFDAVERSDRSVLRGKLFNEVEMFIKQCNNTSVETKLVILPQYTEFADYLELVEELEEQLEQTGMSDIIQVATFHPQYQFQGSALDDVENYTNRSPYAMLHFLQVQQVSDAVKNYGDTDSIWQRNIERLRHMGLKKVQQIQTRIARGDNVCD